MAPLDPHLYPYHDEVGTLYLTYGRMLDAMQEKLQLEQEVVKQERIFQGLEIPYRVIDVASGDLGAPAYRKFDIEAWMPGRGDSGDWA